MRVPVIYASVEGQTASIAKAVAEQLRRLGHEPVLCNADEANHLPLEGAEAAVLAAPVHERRHPRRFEALLVAHKAELDDLRTLMLSVSLSAAFPEGREDAEDYLIEMEMRTGFTADRSLLVAGAVRLEAYDYFASQVVRHVVLRGRPYDPRLGTHEFTDWKELETTIAEFAA